MTITLPIYFTETFAKKKPHTFLVGLSWYRNAHHFSQNKVKQYYHQLVKDQLPPNFIPIEGSFIAEINLYYKNSLSDAPNVIATVEKFVLDALQEHKVIVNDNVKYYVGASWFVTGSDKDNPRIEFTIKEFNAISK